MFIITIHSFRICCCVSSIERASDGSVYLLYISAHNIVFYFFQVSIFIFYFSVYEESRIKCYAHTNICSVPYYVRTYIICFAMCLLYIILKTIYWNQFLEIEVFNIRFRKVSYCLSCMGCQLRYVLEHTCAQRCQNDMQPPAVSQSECCFCSLSEQ